MQLMKYHPHIIETKNKQKHFEKSVLNVKKKEDLILNLQVLLLKFGVDHI